MSKRVLIAAGLAAVLAGGSAVALAQGPGGRRGPGGHMRGGAAAFLNLRGLDLTEAQQTQVRSILESHKAAFDEVRTKARDAHRAFAEATRAESIDEAAIRARSAEVAAAMADQAVLQAKVRGEVLNILTAEQKQKLEQQRAARQQRMQERQQQRQQRQQQRPPQQ
jgi:protein CpxP